MASEGRGEVAGPSAHPGRNLAWCLLVLALALAGVVLVAFYTGVPTWQVPAAYVALLGAVVALPLSAAVAWRGPARAPAVPLAAGVAFVAGGTGLDVAATLWHTPDLAQEGNYVARALLDSGHSVGFVLAAGAVGQVASTGAVIFAWAGLLRHRHLIVADMPAGGAVLPTLKAATGGANRTWRQLVLPLRSAELPDAYHLWWACTAVIVAGWAYRWYLGLEWLDLVPYGAPYRAVVQLIAGTAGVAGYVLWLSSAARSPRGSDPAEPGAAPDPAA